MPAVAKDPLASMLADPGRQPILGALPVVSVRGDDDSRYQASVKRVSSVRIDLLRRDRDHGTIVELLRPDLAGDPETAAMHERWTAARPFVLRGQGITDGSVADLIEAWAGADEAGRATAWLCERGGELHAAASLVDTERDLLKLITKDPEGWLKLGRLSTHRADRSRRICFGVGDEVDDDDHPSAERHASVFDWAQQVFEPLRAAAESQAFATVCDASGRALRPSNPIVYWNRPNGGALFHHDALPGFLPATDSANESTTERAQSGQRGVLFFQAAGETVWLAISIGDLAKRVCEFVDAIVDGAAPWMFEELVEQGVWDPLFLRTRSEDDCLAQLGRDDGGAAGPLIHGSLEFTGFLIDSGHACVLHPGDAIALPNQGVHATAMHSVYCGSEGPNVGFSIGLR